MLFRRRWVFVGGHASHVPQAAHRSRCEIINFNHDQSCNTASFFFRTTIYGSTKCCYHPHNIPKDSKRQVPFFILFFVFFSLINIIYSSMHMQLQRHPTQQHLHLTMTVNDDGHITANTTTSIGRIFFFFFFLFSCFILLISIATGPCTCNDDNDVRPINTTTLHDSNQRLQPLHSQHNCLEW